MYCNLRRTDRSGAYADFVTDWGRFIKSLVGIMERIPLQDFAQVHLLRLNGFCLDKLPVELYISGKCVYVEDR